MNTNIDSTAESFAHQATISLSFPQHWKEHFITLVRQEDIDDQIQLIRLEQSLRDGKSPEIIATVIDAVPEGGDVISEILLESLVELSEMEALPTDFDHQIFYPDTAFDRVDLSGLDVDDNFDAASGTTVCEQIAGVQLPPEWPAGFASMIHELFGDDGIKRAASTDTRLRYNQLFIDTVPANLFETKIKLEIMKDLFNSFREVDQASRLGDVQITRMDELEETRPAPADAKVEGKILSVKDIESLVTDANVQPSRRPYDPTQAGHRQEQAREYDVQGGQFGDHSVERRFATAPRNVPRVREYQPTKPKPMKTADRLQRLEAAVFGDPDNQAFRGHSTTPHGHGPEWMLRHPGNANVELHREAVMDTRFGRPMVDIQELMGMVQELKDHARSAATLQQHFNLAVHVGEMVVNYQKQLGEVMYLAHRLGVRTGHPYAKSFSDSINHIQQYVLGLLMSAV